jgi:hypothetical protein
MLEARLAGKLSHPNVVQIFDVSEVDDRPFIVMEYVPGETLAELLGRRGTLKETEAVELALQACAGLEHAHRAKLVHRDIKPQNLLVREDGTLKIADFGIARAAEDKSMTQTGAVLGTRPYLSPERERGDDAGPEADVYAMGVVISEMVGGRAGEPLVKVVTRSLESEPKKRYRSAAGLRRALAGLGNERTGRPAIADLVERTRTAVTGMLPGGEDAETSMLAEGESDGGKTAVVPVAKPEKVKRVEVPSSVGRPPQIRRRSSWARPGRRGVAAIAAAALLLGGAGAIVIADQGSPGGADRASAGSGAPAGGPDLSGQPADNARSLADWLRAHSR